MEITPNLLKSFNSNYDYKGDKQFFLNVIYTASLNQNLDFFLYSHFSTKKPPTIYSSSKISGTLDKEKLTYSLTDNGVKYLEENFENLINSQYNDLHKTTRVFQLKYQGSEYDFDMIEVFMLSIYSLQYIFLNDQPKHKIIGLETYIRNRCISINKQLRLEFIKELDWRISRLNHFNRFDYNPDDEEMKLKVSAIYKEGIKLMDKQKFNKNSQEIYNLMVPYFIEQTTYEDFCNLFQSEGAIFKSEISWDKPLNSLYYFIKQLQDEGKTTKSINFKVAEKLFIKDNKTISNLTNNKSLSNEAYKIDEIIKLF